MYVLKKKRFLAYCIVVFYPCSFESFVFFRSVTMNYQPKIVTNPNTMTTPEGMLLFPILLELDEDDDVLLLPSLLTSKPIPDVPGFDADTDELSVAVIVGDAVELAVVGDVAVGDVVGDTVGDLVNTVSTIGDSSGTANCVCWMNSKFSSPVATCSTAPFGNSIVIVQLPFGYVLRT
jgi:hypothetical protein